MKPRRRPGASTLENEPRYSVPSRPARGERLRGGASSYQRSPYGLSSTSGTLARCAAATMASRRASDGITRPVGFWKLGSTYMKRVPSGSAATASGNGPSASPATDANSGLVRIEGLQRAQVGGRLDGHRARRRPASPCRRGRGPCCEPLVISTRSAGASMPLGAEHGRDPVAQRTEAFAGRVLQRLTRRCRTARLALASRIGLDGEGVGRRQAAGERPHARQFGELEDLADDRRIHAVAPLGQVPGRIRVESEDGEVPVMGKAFNR